MTPEEFSERVNEVIHLVCCRDAGQPINRVRVMAAAFGRVLGGTATDREALDRGIKEFLDLAKDGAYLYMGQRERGEVPNE